MSTINFLDPLSIEGLGKQYDRCHGPFAVDKVDFEKIFPGFFSIPADIHLDYRKGNLEPVDILLINRLVKYLQPKIILEIGTFDGRTTYNMLKHAPESKVITVDLTEYPKEFMGPDRKYIEFWDKGQHIKGLDSVTQILADSTSKQCQTELDKCLNGEKIDFAFIDGGHSFEVVKSDFENVVLPRLSDGGVVVFDDYNRLLSEMGVIGYLVSKASDEGYVFYWYAPKDKEHSHEAIFINKPECKSYDWRSKTHSA